MNLLRMIISYRDVWNYKFSVFFLLHTYIYSKLLTNHNFEIDSWYFHNYRVVEGLPIFALSIIIQNRWPFKFYLEFAVCNRYISQTTSFNSNTLVTRTPHYLHCQLNTRRYGVYRFANFNIYEKTITVIYAGATGSSAAVKATTTKTNPE